MSASTSTGRWGPTVTGQRETTRYATPSLKRALSPADMSIIGWKVFAHPYGEAVGLIMQHASGWTAADANLRYVGLWPTKQAAAEVLVKQAGYEVGEI